MNYGSYAGQMLWVDLSTGEAQSKATDIGILKDFIGGRGVGIRLLMELAPPGVDPLAPENPMILATGPYTGTGVLSAFFNVTTKSPLTGIAASSHCGGYWGPELKKAGFDGIVITGASAEPCYLQVEEGKAVLKPAAGLWGRGVFETEKLLRETEGKAEILSIGPAGENLVKFAAMMNHQRAAGRSGVGAVMGSKKLKAIVVRGNLPIRAVRSGHGHGNIPGGRQARPCRAARPSRSTDPPSRSTSTTRNTPCRRGISGKGISRNRPGSTARP